ncbi:MAG: BrnT family toxin [Thermoanaerobaculia bacterium]
MELWERLAQATGFDWDAGNIDKNWESHRVAFWEAEEVFFNQPLVVAADLQRSQREERFVALGKTDAKRRLFVAFTFREDLIRIVSARDMGRQERREYEHHEPAQEEGS